MEAGTPKRRSPRARNFTGPRLSRRIRANRGGIAHLACQLEHGRSIRDACPAAISYENGLDEYPSGNETGWSHSHTHTLAHSHTLTLTHPHTHTLRLERARRRARGEGRRGSASTAADHSHTHTCTHSQTHTPKHSHTHTLSHSHTHTLTYSHTHTHTLTHPHTHKLRLERARRLWGWGRLGSASTAADRAGVGVHACALEL